MLTRPTGADHTPSDLAPDAGISLVEVLIAMVISVVVGSIMVTYLISSVNNARRADGQNEQAAGARVVLDSWAALVPLAVDPNGESAPGSVRFYSIAPKSARFCLSLGTKSMTVGAADAAPMGVELALVGDDLIEKRYATCALMVSNGTNVRRILAPHVALTAVGAWLLTPLSRADLIAHGSTAGDDPELITGQTPLSALIQSDATKIANIAGLQLAFKTLAAPGRPAPPAEYTVLLGLNAGGSAVPTRRFRARILRPRRHRSGDDGGQALVLVMLVTFMVMLVAGTSVSITASNIAPSRRTADAQAAQAAAQSGIDEFGLALAICDVDYLIGDCPTIYSTAKRPLVGADGVTRATYAWDLSETPDDDRGLFRVTSTGEVNGTARSLVADYRPTPSFLDFLYFSEVESISPELNRRYYGPRTIQIPTSSFRTAADRRSGYSSVTWGGVQGEEICGQTWYDPPFGQGRATIKALQGYEFRETTNAPIVTRNATCDVYFVDGQTFSGRVYSKDAFLFSGYGPMFLKPIRTEWSTSRVPAPPVPKFYRGDASARPGPGSEVPKVAAGKMSMPEGLETIETESTCVFTGPTRIKLEGATAVVTSPGTTLDMLKAGCAPSGSGSTLLAPGLVQVPFPVTNTTSFYVKDGVAGGPASQANPLFDLRPPVTIGGAVGGQPALFYSEMNTVGLPVNDTTTKSAVAGPVSIPVHTALQTWITEVNATKPVGVAATPQYQAITTTTALPSSIDPLLERGAQAATIQRRTCTLTAAKVCAASPTPTAWTNAITVTRASHTLPMLGDITPYETGLGNAFVEGHLTGKLTIAGENTVVITDNTTYDGTAAVPTGTLGLVGDHFVEIYHPVKCATVYTALPTTPNHCPDDITGLDSSSYSETYHPSRRYLNLRGTELDNIEIDAAILAREGSFTLQNYIRGLWMGTNTVTGGVYQQFRGPTGIGWGGSSRSGYTTSMAYDPRLDLFPPPNFVEPSEALTNSAWLLLGISGPSGGG